MDERTATLAELLTTAMQAKARELGVKRYAYRDLGRDAQVDFSYAQKTIQYGRSPSAAIIRAWAKALAPYLPLDDALLAGGYLPDDPERMTIVRRLLRYSADQLNRLAEATGTLFSEPVPDVEPEHKASDGNNTDGEQDAPSKHAAIAGMFAELDRQPSFHRLTPVPQH